MNVQRKLLIPLFTAGLFGLMLSGCDRPESAADTRADVAEAQSDGREDVADAREDAAESRTDARKDVMDAQQDVNQAAVELSRESADGNREVAFAQAQAAHGVAIEKCDASTGDMRDACKKEADEALERAKTQAY